MGSVHERWLRDALWVEGHILSQQADGARAACHRRQQQRHHECSDAFGARLTPRQCVVIEVVIREFGLCRRDPFVLREGVRGAVAAFLGGWYLLDKFPPPLSQPFT